MPFHKHDQLIRWVVEVQILSVSLKFTSVHALLTLEVQAHGSCVCFHGTLSISTETEFEIII